MENPKSVPANDCIINRFFVDANDPTKERLKYCRQNCVFLCLHGKEYKTMKGSMVIMAKEKWEPFWFEGNFAWGFIKSKDHWERIKIAYDHNVKLLAGAKSWDDYKYMEHHPYFGFYSECDNGTDTLGEFAKRNGMAL